MLKLSILVLWITPAVLLFIYLLWISKRSVDPASTAETERPDQRSAELENLNLPGAERAD